MNWKRGLFRVWAVVSLLWLLLAGGFAVALFSTQEQQTRQPTFAEIARCELENPGPWCSDPWAEFPRVEYATKWRVPPWQVWAGVVAVPLLLLSFGATGYWVARGFIRSN